MSIIIISKLQSLFHGFQEAFARTFPRISGPGRERHYLLETHSGQRTGVLYGPFRDSADAHAGALELEVRDFIPDEGIDPEYVRVMITVDWLGRVKIRSRPGYCLDERTLERCRKEADALDRRWDNYRRYLDAEWEDRKSTDREEGSSRGDAHASRLKPATT